MEPESFCSDISENKREQGQGLVEYALILVIVSLMGFLLFTIAGEFISGTFRNVQYRIEGSECLRDSNDPANYYYFFGEANVVPAPAIAYTNALCISSNGFTSPSAVVKGEFPQAQANQLCQSVGASTAVSDGRLYFCN